MSNDNSNVEHPEARLARIIAAQKTTEPEAPAIYQVVQSPVQVLGLTHDKKLTFGLELKLVFSHGYDPVSEELDNGWEGDCLCRILLPDEGLQLGKYYYGMVANPVRDWETNAIEDWDTQLVEWTGPLPEGALCEDEGCPHHGTDHVCLSKPA